MESDRTKWNERYSGKDYFFSLGPSKFLAQSLGQLRGLVPGRRALDIACGEGRNAIFLAQNGFEVDAVDIAELGLERGRRRAAGLGLQINFMQEDLDRYQLQGVYHLIVDFNFLLRPLIPAMVAALAPGGVIVMETILNASTLQGVHHSEFLLEPGEMEGTFSGFEGSILLVEEDPSQETPVARVLFRKG